MKHKSYLLPFVLVVLAACGTLGVPSPQTFNEREAAAIVSVTTARSTAISLLTAGKITADDAQNVQEQANNAREGITIADTLHATNAAAGEDRLTLAVAMLTELQKYLNTRK